MHGSMNKHPKISKLRRHYISSLSGKGWKTFSHDKRICKQHVARELQVGRTCLTV